MNKRKTISRSSFRFLVKTLPAPVDILNTNKFLEWLATHLDYNLIQEKKALSPKIYDFEYENIVLAKMGEFSKKRIEWECNETNKT